MDLTKVSKKLSYLLRHSTEPLYISLDNGWADTDEIIKVLKEKYPEADTGVLEQIVSSDEKDDIHLMKIIQRSGLIRDIRFRG